MLGETARSRASTALTLALLWANVAHAASVISSITVGGDDRSLEVDVRATGPLSYLLTESPKPFTLTFLFGDASLGFPDERRGFAGDGLSELQARTLTREGSTLAKLDLTFSRPVRYTVTREGSEFRLRAEVPGPNPPVVIGLAHGSSPAAASPGAQPPASPMPAAPPPATPGPAPLSAPPVRAAPPASEPAELRAVHPESGGRTAQVELDIAGTPLVKTFAMTGPARVVVDLENARVTGGTGTLHVGSGLLRGVRISQHTKTVVRVVCDLSRPAPFRVESVSSGLIVHLGEGVR